MPKFHIVRVDGRTVSAPMNDPNTGATLVCRDDWAAQQWVDYFTRHHGGKYQPRVVKTDVDWRKRELDRFESGHYAKLPWHNEPWVSKVKKCADHFAHVSKQSPESIAYTADEDKAERDIKSVMRPSKYLLNFYGKLLSEHDIRAWVASYKKLYDKENLLSFAYDAKDIVRVYKHGPHSCMKKNVWRTKIHPASVYAGPDLAVAYIEKGKHIVARTVCWPKKRIYTRIYGDGYLLEELLQEEGYKQGSIEGARLTKIKSGNRYVCPYIDYTPSVRIGRKYLTITKSGKHFAGNQDGFCGQGFNCGHCHQERALKIAVADHHVVNGAHWCNDCFQSALAIPSIFLCGASRQYYSIEHRVVMGNGQQWHRNYRASRNFAFQCADCKEYYPNNDAHRDVRASVVKCRTCATVQQELAL